MTDIQTPDFTASASVGVGSLGLATEHAVVGLGLGAIALLWVIRFGLPRP